jgi:hypothetical protein
MGPATLATHCSSVGTFLPRCVFQEAVNSPLSKGRFIAGPHLWMIGAKGGRMSADNG